MCEVRTADLSAVDLATVADLDYPNDPLGVVHAVDDPVVSLPNPVPVCLSSFSHPTGRGEVYRHPSPQARLASPERYGRQTG